MKIKEKLTKFHDRYYKLLLIFPLLLLILSIGYIIYFYKTTGDFIKRDISLKGGTTITINEKININDLSLYLSKNLDDFNIREISDLITREQKAVIVETTENPDKAKEILEKYLGYELTQENSSIEFSGSSLSQNFYKQLAFAVLLAFLFMSLVVFVLFRTFIPSLAVIISAFADITMTLALVNFLGLRISSAGIMAFLMLIGYSVDTDILLTNRVLKRKQESLNKKLFGAFKTGVTMSFTSLLAMSGALLIVYTFSETLSQIFTILVIGLFFDLINTWITNVSILKWYSLKKENEN